MPEGADNQDWKCLNVAVREKASGRVLEYRIHFYRRTNGWYDEVCYDSHEIRRGRKTSSPHMHLKTATPFKDAVAGEEELKRIIDLILPQIKEMTR